MVYLLPIPGRIRVPKERHTMSYKPYNNTVPFLARHTRSVEGQRTLLETRPEFAAALAQNPHLDREIWFRLARRPKADVAYGLVDRQLDLEQLRALVGDKRVTVRRNILSSGLKSCTEEMGRLIISLPWFDSESATLWCASQSVPDRLLKEVALVAGRNELIKLMADPDRFTIEEIIALLPQVDLSRTRQSLYRLVDVRPELVPYAVSVGVENPRLVEAAAGSRHLFGAENFSSVLQTIELLGGQNTQGCEILLSAASNPNIPLEHLEQLVAKFPRRLIGYGNRFRPANNATILEHATRRLSASVAQPDRPWDDYAAGEDEVLRRAVHLLGSFRFPTLSHRLSPAVPQQPATGANRHVGNEELASLLFLPNGNGSSPVRLVPATVTQVSIMLDEHGSRAWETFWSLIDSWQGDLASLVDSSIALAA